MRLNRLPSCLMATTTAQLLQTEANVAILTVDTPPVHFDGWVQGHAGLSCMAFAF